MVNTKLVLIEGLPGSGKSTTARRLGTVLRQQAVDCQGYLEDDQLHPIACLDFPLRELARELPPLWRSLTNQLHLTPAVAIVESRLWQNTAMFMYMSEYPVPEILHLQQLVERELWPLAPVLVYLDQDNVEHAMRRHFGVREAAALAGDLQMTAEYPWFQSRGLSGLAGWVQFFQEWQGVAEQLYQAWPHRKLRVVNAHEGWASAYAQIDEFLQLEAST